MNRLLGPILILLIASIAYSQDAGDIGNLAGDVNGLLNIPAPRGNTPPPNRGTPPRGGQPAAPAIDRLARLREMLVAAKAPLNGSQESALNALILAELPAMRASLQARAEDLRKLSGQANPDELLADLNRLNDQLVGKIASAPILTPEQQGVVKRAWKDQIRSHGGFEAINLTMEEANVPFSPEQASQIRALFEEQNLARTQMLRSLQGQPADPAKLAQLQTDTLRKVLRLLSAAQRAALSVPATRTQ